MEENDNYQWNKVKQLLEYAYDNIPYYKELFIKLGATPNDIKTWSDFRKIPYLTKEIVREKSDDLIPRNIKKSKLRYHTTGGSTGIPLGFYKLREEQMIEHAFMFHQWGRVGYKETSKRVILKAQPLKNNKLFIKFRFTNDWFMSSRLLSKEYIKQYVVFLNHIKPEFFHVHPSCFFKFTQLLIASKLNLNFYPKAVLCGSEPVFDYQRDLFEKIYKTRVYTWLGLAEGTTLAGECEYSKSFHVWPQYSYVELVDKNDMPVNKKGLVGAIIGTNLKSLDTPFIRYKSEDLATLGSNKCNLCGRNHMIFDTIEGRKQDVIIMADGGELLVALIPHMIAHEFNNALNGIKMMQIIQEVKGEILIKFSITNDFNKADEAKIRAIIKSACHDQLSVKFEYSDDFIRSKSGKRILFIQKIKNIN
ncbi:MAG: phenylacetate--CoA ligase family protein [Bacteroidales bacterium]|nr:phenylacetate--CoA ligase family protein [Bacteroidales bacterium]